MLIEAGRRLGLTSQARTGLDTKVFGALAGVDADTVAVRVAVDEGQLAAAAALLAGLDAEGDEEVVASRWYLARAQGDLAACVALAREYEALRTSPLRRLEQLVPLNKR